MQPNTPSGPRPPSVAPSPRSSIGPGLVIGVIALLAFVYLLEHASKGETAIFGDADQRISEQDFRRGQCTAVFGACKIDLRDAQIQGREAVLETYAIFGGVEIRVPQDWEVVNRSIAVFGGIDDHRREPPSGPGTKTLILNGAAVFGGVTVKD